MVRFPGGSNSFKVVTLSIIRTQNAEHVQAAWHLVTTGIVYVCMYICMYVCSPVAIPTELYEADIIGLFEANINDLMESLTFCSLSQDQK